MSTSFTFTLNCSAMLASVVEHLRNSGNVECLGELTLTSSTVLTPVVQHPSTLGMSWTVRGNSPAPPLAATEIPLVQ